MRWNARNAQYIQCSSTQYSHRAFPTQISLIYLHIVISRLIIRTEYRVKLVVVRQSVIESISSIALALL